jgi:membrane protease YdiL (CAAX protease family)
MFTREPLLGNTPVPIKILAFLLVVVMSLAITLLIGIGLGFIFFGGDMLTYVKEGMRLDDAGSLNILRYLQLVNTVGIFILPALLFAFLVSASPARYLSAHRPPSLVSTFIGVAVIVAILPFIHWTAAINEMLQLPGWLSGFEDWMKQSEEQARQLTERFLATVSIPGLLINLLMIAILPAIGEELLFRGVLLRLFREWTGNVHVAVLITALLFSALHLQFYGFLPRLLLGAVLGYIFVWSGSIWVPVLVHFVNNGIAVIAAWLFARGSSGRDFDTIGEADNPVVIIASFVVVLAMMLAMKGYEDKKKGSTIT